MKFTDAVAVGQMKETSEGYLVATARVARTGIQNYLASELGDIAKDEGFSPNDIVRVLRPADEVFSADSLKTITRLPVTVGHPSESVTSDNWASLAVGEVGDAYSTEPEWIIVNPMIKDRAAAEAARTTHKEISMGYTANIIPHAEKSIADFVQTGIRYNHLALVPKGRAGYKARIGDSWGASPMVDYEPGDKPKTPSKGAPTMELKTLVLGDVAVQVAVTDLAAVEAYKASMTQKLADAEAAKKKTEEEKDEEIGRLKADLKKAQDAAVIDVDALVTARTALVAQVKALDSTIEPVGKSDADLRNAAVASKLGDEMVKDASEAEVKGMFAALSKASPANPVADAIKNGVKTMGDSDAQIKDAQNGYAARLTRQTKEA